MQIVQHLGYADQAPGHLIVGPRGVVISEGARFSHHSDLRARPKPVIHRQFASYLIHLSTAIARSRIRFSARHVFLFCRPSLLFYFSHSCSDKPAEQAVFPTIKIKIQNLRVWQNDPGLNILHFFLNFGNKFHFKKLRIRNVVFSNYNAVGFSDFWIWMVV